jgi:hypothetical protein
MRIAFDLDGVLADLGKALEQAAARVTARGQGAEASSVRASQECAVSCPDGEVTQPSESRPAAVPEQLVWRAALEVENFWETLDEIHTGSIRRIAALAHKHRWDVLFITSRPDAPGETTQRQTQRWLARHGFELPSVCVVHGSRGAIAAALDLDVVVDDRPENCLDVVTESKARAILVWRGSARVPEQARRFGIGRVTSVMECLDLLVEADEEPQETPVRFLERLRSLLGLENRPTSVVPR